MHNFTESGFSKMQSIIFWASGFSKFWDFLRDAECHYAGDKKKDASGKAKDAYTAAQASASPFPASSLLQPSPSSVWGFPG